MMRLFARLAPCWPVTAAGRPDPADAVTRERLRIAEELHDVVAHDLSVLTLGVGAGQGHHGPRPRARPADVARRRGGRPPGPDGSATRRGAAAVGRASTTTGPQPTLGALPALFDRFRAAGLSVGFAEEGPRRPSPVLELSAYRIVEEALVNALEHGSARKARVWLRWQGGVVEL